MKTVVGVIAVLVTVGLATLGLLTAQRLSSPPNHVAGPAFPNSDQGTSATAASPSRVMTPWPDLEDLATSAPPAVPVASAPSASSAHQAPQSNAHSGLTGVTTTDSPEASSARSYLATCEKPDALGFSRVV
jgi:hypothetical protein